MTKPTGQSSNVGLSVLAIIVAIVIFVVTWVIGAILFTIFDHFRGLGDDKLQMFFRELVVPGAAGYLAMFAVSSWFQNANTKIVFFGFSGLLFIVIGIYLGLVTPYSDEIGGVGSMLLSLLTLTAGIVGAYIYSKDEL